MVSLSYSSFLGTLITVDIYYPTRFIQPMRSRFRLMKSQGRVQGVHREHMHPVSKICAVRLRYSNRAVTLTKQSHDHKAVHNRFTINKYVIPSFKAVDSPLKVGSILKYAIVLSTYCSNK